MLGGLQRQRHTLDHQIRSVRRADMAGEAVRITTHADNVDGAQANGVKR